MSGSADAHACKNIINYYYYQLLLIREMQIKRIRNHFTTSRSGKVSSFIILRGEKKWRNRFVNVADGIPTGTTKNTNACPLIQALPDTCQDDTHWG